jgi:2-amino-4-hydroxy-6-hydroxymethyldihydropteridine diphosphokinase / dihydropteroate synthase
LIVLGLGTNLGNKLKNLHLAVNELSNGILRDIKTSIIYENKALLPDGAPDSWDMPYYNMIISGKTDLSPDGLLLAIKNIEKKLGRELSERWAPRIIDIDILLYNDLTIQKENLQIPHAEMLNRPFVMLPLYTTLPQLVLPQLDQTVAEFVGDFKPYIGQFERTIAFKPKIMGIVNVTPDSFSDGGDFLAIDSAIQRAIDLVHDGAYHIDFGAQSTWAKSEAIGPQGEIDRLAPVIDGFMAEMMRRGLSVDISVDTFYPEVIESIMKHHRIDIINDVSAANNKRLIEIAASENIKYVLMHSVDIPTHLANLIPFDTDAVDTLKLWASNKISELAKHGLKKDNIIFDPGIGFDKSPSQNFEIFRKLGQFRSLGTEILVGHSRKYYHNAFTSKSSKDRDFETALMSSYIYNDADYLRVHNVDLTHRAIVTRHAAMDN